jgi:hypothetical protein
MKKIVLFFGFFLLLFLLSGCTFGFSDSSENLSGVMLEWELNSENGREVTHVICNNGDMYEKFKTKDYAHYKGQTSSKDLKELRNDLGEKTIQYEGRHSPPEGVFGAGSTYKLNYFANRSKMDITDEEYKDISNKIRRTMEENESYFTLKLIKTNDTDFLVEWRDYATLSFLKLLGDNYDTRVYVTDLSEEQNIIIERMTKDFKEKGLNYSVPKYTVKEGDSFFTVSLFGEFVSITKYPDDIFTMDELVSGFGYNSNEIKSWETSGDFAIVDISDVSDQESIEKIRDSKLRQFRLLWPEGVKTKVGEYNFYLGYKEVPLEQICE